MTFVPDRSGVNPLDRRYSSSNRTVANSAAVAAATPSYPGEIIRALDTGRPYRALSGAPGAWGGGAVANPASGIPAGVTFQSIDGGADYYARNGFANAAAAGWDSNVVPICQFLESMLGGLNGPAIMNDTNCNTLLAMQADGGSIATLRNNGISFIPQYHELDQIISTGGASPGSETVGVLAWDEPGSYQQAIDGLQLTPNIYQDGKFWYENYTWNQLVFGDVEGHKISDLADDLITTPNGAKRHLDVLALDIYWMAGDAGGDGGAYNSGKVYGFPDPPAALLTSDQRRRGCRYGDVVTWIRESYRVYEAGFGQVNQRWYATYPAPTAVWIETGGPYDTNTTLASYIQPAELNAAVWSTIIHGARMILYFGHNFGTAPGSLGGGWVKGTNFYKTIYPGQSISIYDQVKATNALVKQLATVINSRFALGYVTVSPAGWKFGDPGVLGIVDVGFDVMAKFGPDAKFYIFAMPRYSPALTNQVATFTLTGVTTGTATVINEARTRPIAGGQFTDTFANGHTVHIYRID
jgi:hypothetical protein